MALRDELQKTQTGKIDRVVEQLGAWLDTTADMLAKNIPLFLKAVEDDKEGRKLLQSEFSLPMGTLEGTHYIAALTALEATPGFRKLRAFCAAPECDAAFVLELDTTGRHGQRADFRLKLEPEKPFEKSLIRGWTGSMSPFERPLASTPAEARPAPPASFGPT